MPLKKGWFCVVKASNSAELETNRRAATDMLYKYLVYTGLLTSMPVSKSNIVCAADA